MPDFTCATCNRTFKEVAHLNQHKLASHGQGDVQNRITCDFCDKSFTSVPAKQQHIADSHPESTPPTAPMLTTKPGGENVLKCRDCSRSYASDAALQQHIADSHPKSTPPTAPGLTTIPGGKNVFKCSVCSRSYTSDAARQQHERDSHLNDDQAKQNGPLSSLECLRSSLPKKDSAKQPQQTTVQAVTPTTKTLRSKRKPFPCSKCNDSFDTNAACLQHMSTKHADENPSEGKTSGLHEHVCTTCYTTFDTKMAAVQHTGEKKDHVIKKSTRKLAVDCFLKAAQVVAADRQESVALYRKIVKDIIEHIRTEEGGKIYSTDVRTAGSTAVNVKIGKADEFDTNIPLNITVKELITSGHIDYIYEDRIDQMEGQKYKINLNKERRIVKCQPRRIPEGQAVVKVSDGSVPANLVYGEDLIPHKCMKDFFDKVKAAIDSPKLDIVKLSREAHGPAITLTIVPEGKHAISVDLTLSLACSLKLSQYGWPRENTRRAIRQEKIAECLKTPIHLVPKGSDTWSISFSKAEETLLQGIDTGNECRRHVMQVMKRHLQILASRNPLEGISSYILKQQILWSAEKHADDGYWHQKNLDQCVIDVMGDFIETLKQGQLPHFFKPTVNILEHKRQDVLRIIMKYFENERSKLLRME